MKPKKKFLSATAAILGVFTAIGMFCFMNNWQIVNVFDEMYMAVEHPQVTEADFYHVSEMGRLISEPDMKEFYWGGYKTNSLRDEERITVTADMDENKFTVIATQEIANTRGLQYCYRYDFKTKTLEIEPLAIVTQDYVSLGVANFIDDADGVSAFLHDNNLTREMVEQYQHYFLYEKLLTDWVNGNGDKSRFSTDDLGEFTVVDNTFSQLGEDWGK